MVEYRCGKCNGQGVILANKCKPCDGSGMVEINRTDNLHLKHNKHGVIVFPNKGNLPINAKKPGDLKIKLDIEPHEKYSLVRRKVSGSKKSKMYIQMCHTISLLQAVTGTSVDIQTPFISKKKIQIPASSNYDDEILVKGGVSEHDHIVKIKIDLPADLNDTQIKGLYDYQQVEKPVARNFA